MELVRITDGQITIPVQIRALLQLESGDSVLLVEDEGKIVVEKLSETETAAPGDDVEAQAGQGQ